MPMEGIEFGKYSIASDLLLGYVCIYIFHIGGEANLNPYFKISGGHSNPGQGWKLFSQHGKS